MAVPESNQWHFDHLIPIFWRCWLASVVVLTACGIEFSILLSAISSLLFCVTLYLMRVSPRADIVTERDRILGKGPQIIAHRGAGHDAPENTLAAFQLAAKNGATGVEYDLEFTSDGHPVLLHDSTVDRTTDSKGQICDISFEDLRKLNAAHNHLKRSVHGTLLIPTLDETIEECLKLKLKMYIDIKSDHPKLLDVLAEAFEKYPALYTESVCGSFYPQVIYKVRCRFPQAVCALTWRPHVLTYSDVTCTVLRNTQWYRRAAAPLADVLLDNLNHLVFWYLCGVNVFLVNKNFVSERYKVGWAERNVRLVLWTVNRQREKTYFREELGLSYMTDCLTGEECGDSCRHELFT